MKKNLKKRQKRMHIDAAKKVQDAWIESYGLDKPTTRRERDHRFNAAQQLSLILSGGIRGVA